MIDTEIVQGILVRFGAIERWQTGVQLATNLLTLMPTILPVTVGEMETAVTLFAATDQAVSRHAMWYTPPSCKPTRSRTSFPPTNILIKSKGSSASIRRPCMPIGKWVS